MAEKNLVCLNDGSYTRMNINTGKESVLELTLVLSSISARCDWSEERKQKKTSGGNIVTQLKR